MRAASFLLVALAAGSSVAQADMTYKRAGLCTPCSAGKIETARTPKSNGECDVHCQAFRSTGVRVVSALNGTEAILAATAGLVREAATSADVAQAAIAYNYASNQFVRYADARAASAAMPGEGTAAPGAPGQATDAIIAFHRSNWNGNSTFIDTSFTLDDQKALAASLASYMLEGDQFVADRFDVCHQISTTPDERQGVSISVSVAIAADGKGPQPSFDSFCDVTAGTPAPTSTPPASSAPSTASSPAPSSSPTASSAPVPSSPASSASESASA